MSDPSELERARAHLAAIIESSEDAIVSEDLDGIMQSWNHGAELIYGFTADEVLGKHASFRLRFLPENLAERDEIVDRIHRGERIAPYRTKRVRKDGRIIDVSLSAAPLRDASGAIVGAASIVRDITDQVRTEEALARQALELQRSNAELERFAYVASHDLQEPLRTITSFVQLLARRYKGKLDADADEFIQYAVDGASRMRVLIQDLLDLARIHSRGDTLVPVSLEEILAETLQGLQAVLAESGAAVTHGPLPVVYADPVQMRQLFSNFIGNALKFRGTDPPAVHVQAERQGAGWSVSIRDNGIGIEPQYLERIFIVFQRLHGRDEYPGTGIGLALCKRIVERHGGRIWVESEPGRGSAFFFTLPKAPGATEGEESSPPSLQGL
jgi:PAS domain S-box-containing protein